MVKKVLSIIIRLRVKFRFNMPQKKMTGEHKKAQKAVNFWARIEEEAKEGLLKKVN